MLIAIFLIAALMALGVATVVTIMEVRKRYPLRLLLVGVGLLCVGSLIAMIVLDHISPDDRYQAWLDGPTRSY